MPRRKEKRECEDCGVSALETHLEYIKSDDIYLCEYCLASSSYADANYSKEDTYQYKGRSREDDSDDDYN